LNGKFVKNLEDHKGPVTSVSFSANGKIIATASHDGTVKLWGLDGTLRKTLNAGSLVTSVSFNPNGDIIAAGCEDKTVKLWHLDERLNGTPLPSLTGHENTVLDVSFSPNGKMIASASAGRDRNLMLWDLNGQRRAVLKGHQGNIYRVKFSPSGQTLVSAGRDSTIRFWNLKGDLLRTWEGNNENFVDVSFNSNGTALASADTKGKVILRDFNLDNLLQRSCSWLHNYLQRQDYSTLNLNGSRAVCR
jgi:WD40 repeat protein